MKLMHQYPKKSNTDEIAKLNQTFDYDTASATLGLGHFLL